MRHGHADSYAGIFEDEYVRDFRLGGEFAVTPDPEVDYFSPMFSAELGWREIMLRVIEYDVAVPARCGSPVEALHFLERLIVRLKRREVVGINVNVVVIRNMARARAKRALILRHLRAILPVRRHHHPLTQ